MRTQLVVAAVLAPTGRVVDNPPNSLGNGDEVRGEGASYVHERRYNRLPDAAALLPGTELRSRPSRRRFRSRPADFRPASP